MLSLTSIIRRLCLGDLDSIEIAIARNCHTEFYHKEVAFLFLRMIHSYIGA